MLLAFRAGVLVALLLPSVPLHAGPAPGPEARPVPVRAVYAGPTDRYPHNIMGRIRGWSALEVDLSACQTCPGGNRRLRIELPASRVFEDFAPRLWDITGDGIPEVVTVESDLAEGSRLVVWEGFHDGNTLSLRRLAATPFIGTRFRWLAPIGVADFDGDGALELAYVEKPHRDRILRLVRLDLDRLVTIASLPGVTNHSIGQEGTAGLVRTCAGVTEIVLLSADGRNVVAVTLKDSGLQSRSLGAAAGPRLPNWAAKC